MKTISESQRLQLIGLITIAASLDQRLHEIERAASEITGEEGDGHTMDAVFQGYGNRDPVVATDDMLRKLGIEVKP